MKNWKHINGAEVGNEGLSLWEKLKTAGKDHIVMKSADGGEVQIKKDGEAWYKKDNQSQIVRDKHSSFEKAVEAYKLHGFKIGNQDGVARMFQGLVKDEKKDEKKDSGAIDDLEKVGNKVGNAKSIWELPDGRMATVKEDGTVEIKKKGDSSLYVYKVWDKERAERQLERKGAKKVGNSASDDKFAYVMREFDEGKLKSSSGETVTDPEQAKAIAYSESKKAENGLVRARKAMKV